LSVDDMHALRRLWYVSEKGAERGPVDALVRFALGFPVSSIGDAQPGDFIQYWRTGALLFHGFSTQENRFSDATSSDRGSGGSGHSVVLKELIKDEIGKVVGLHYWSSQSSTAGIGYRTEYFEGGIQRSIIRSRTYIVRSLKV
jgi:hypothetical protein